jgi:hypothetical protein
MAMDMALTPSSITSSLDLMLRFATWSPWRTLSVDKCAVA